ncbi:cell wall-binding repeat-containing protein [Peptostreptococcus russellii]|uniref:cell wall-binding repeat-containing protein n=1 Tax=Peptostreptococcus russellii TaxID=215200 RepID=UPI000D0EB312|nr:cell wall-binding repeat-containing protein [Peptostreptococcus russellii]
MICCTLSASTIIAASPIVSNASNDNIDEKNHAKKDHNKVDLEGYSRFDTANKIALNYFKNPENVILVNSNAIADALSVAPYAKKLEAPVLLTNSDSLESKTKKTIEKLNPRNIILKRNKSPSS